MTLLELCVDTSTRYASVALCRDGDLMTSLSWCADRHHSVELVPAIRLLLDRTGAAAGALQTVFVATGPGGFSSLRVGLSTCKALALASGIPLVGVGTLDVEAAPYLECGLDVMAVLPAGRGLLYARVFPAGGDGRLDEEPVYDVATPEALAAGIKAPTLVCGEASGEIESALRSRAERGPGRVAGVPPPTRLPGVMAVLGRERMARTGPSDLDALQPLYLRGAQFEAARRAASPG